MKKLVIFDMDGVLVDAKEIHRQALNDALGEYRISYEDHLNIFDGKPTRAKLEILAQTRGLPRERIEEIYKAKQEITSQRLSELPPIPHIVEALSFLKSKGFLIAVASNSIRNSVYTALSSSGLIRFCDVVLSNQDVKHPKPHPEIYWKAMSCAGVLPSETLIVEDSPVGLAAAHASGATVMRVCHPGETTVENLCNHMNTKEEKPTWSDPGMNVLIPMAGRGSRFEQAGYTFPKPLIDVNGKPMIQVVVDCLGIRARYHFVVQKEHREKYNLDSMLGLIAPGCRVLEVDGVTSGAAVTALVARHEIDCDKPLFFANSDQYVEWDPLAFFYEVQEKKVDGAILTFRSTHPKWSYAAVENGRVTRVAEKDPISDVATTGLYYWKKGSDFVKYADEMIEADERVNGEFYVAPVFNRAIRDGKRIVVHDVKEMRGLGTPEDLAAFLK